MPENLFIETQFLCTEVKKRIWRGQQKNIRFAGPLVIPHPNRYSHLAINSFQLLIIIKLYTIFVYFSSTAVILLTPLSTNIGMYI